MTSGFAESTLFGVLLGGNRGRHSVSEYILIIIIIRKNHTRYINHNHQR